MKRFTQKLGLVAMMATAVLFTTSCDKEEETPVNESKVSSNTVKDLDASETYVYYNLSSNEIVPASDSASDKWDIAFYSTTILINSGTSGPGMGEAQVVELSFDEITEAPETGYAMDSESGNAVPKGSGNGWYNYNPSTHIVSPIPGRTIVLKTADGEKYAKVEILSYYKGAPANPTYEENGADGRVYTFRYSIQENGTAQF